MKQIAKLLTLTVALMAILYTQGKAETIPVTAEGGIHFCYEIDGERHCIGIYWIKGPAEYPERDIKVSASQKEKGVLILSDIPKDLEGAMLKIPAGTDSGIKAKEGKVFLLPGKYTIQSGQLKIPVKR